MHSIASILWYRDFGISSYAFDRDWLANDKHISMSFEGEGPSVNEYCWETLSLPSLLTLDQAELPTLSNRRLLRSSVGNENTVEATTGN
jgi:hypothetical protein